MQPTPAPAMTLPQHQLAVNLVAQNLTATSRAGRGGTSKSQYHRVTDNGGAPRLTETPFSSATTSESESESDSDSDSDSDGEEPDLQQALAKQSESAAAVSDTTDATTQLQWQTATKPVADSFNFGCGVAVDTS